MARSTAAALVNDAGQLADEIRRYMLLPLAASELAGAEFPELANRAMEQYARLRARMTQYDVSNSRAMGSTRVWQNPSPTRAGNPLFARWGVKVGVTAAASESELSDFTSSSNSVSSSDETTSHPDISAHSDVPDTVG